MARSGCGPYGPRASVRLNPAVCARDRVAKAIIVPCDEACTWTVRPRPHPFSRSRCILRRSYLRGHVLCVVARLLVRVSRVPREARARTAAGAGAGPDGPWCRARRCPAPARRRGHDMGRTSRACVCLCDPQNAACSMRPSERGALIQPVISRIQKAKLSWCHPRATSPPVAERARTRSMDSA